MTNNAIKALVLALPLTALCAGSADAQNHSVTLKRDALQQVDFYHARKKVDIIDESPIVTDHRRAPQEDVYNVEVGPGPAAQSPRVITIKSSGLGSLPFAGTTSNIPAGGMRPVGNLSPVRSGVMPKYSPPRAIGASAPTIGAAKTEIAIKVARPMEYARGAERNMLHGDGGGQISAQPTVRAQLMGHK